MLSETEARRLAEVFRKTIRDLYSPGFARALLYHIKAKSGLELERLEDVVMLGLKSPRKLYDVLAEVLGGYLAAELFLSTTFREIFTRLDIEFSTEHVVTAFRENDKDGVERIVSLILAATRSVKYHH